MRPSPQWAVIKRTFFFTININETVTTVMLQLIKLSTLLICYKEESPNWTTPIPKWFTFIIVCYTLCDNFLWRTNTIMATGCLSINHLELDSVWSSLRGFFHWSGESFLQTPSSTYSGRRLENSRWQYKAQHQETVSEIPNEVSCCLLLF